MHREYHRWYSHRLHRDMELLVFGHAGAKVMVFPTRDGNFHEYEDLHIVHSLAEKINAGQLQLWCLDTVARETFYCGWRHPADRIQRHALYEEYVLNEVMPLMQQQNAHPCTIAHGCSLGAFLAANMAFRHPQHFQKLAAFSGRYDLTMSVEAFHDLLGGYYDDNVYFHTPSHFLANLNCDWRLAHLRRMDIVMVVGNEDPFLHNNRQLSDILHAKGVHNQLHVWDGRAHRGQYWRHMASLYV
ncbi:MAG: esterase family protein [Rhodoferax sp.]